MADKTHRLDPLLRPRSVAIVGASPKEASYSRRIVEGLIEGGFEGAVYPVNPGYEEILGLDCYPDLASLPEVPDLAVLSVANARIEAAMQAAAEIGVPAAVIYGSCQLDDGNPVALKDRLQRIAEEAGMMVCGGNGMGFYNREDRVNLQLANVSGHEEAGNIAFITHSGSVLMAYCHNQNSVGFNLSVSPGQEFTASAADYLDFALTLSSTRVACLFIETVRNSEGFVAALKKAATRNIPVVICKVGRSDAARAFAVTHTGALAGDDKVFDAVCDRYGVIRVDDLDDMMATVQLLAMDKPVAPTGGLVALLDSGGERELLADTAEQFGVVFPKVTEETRKKLEGLLDDGFEAENPVDAWGAGHDFENQFSGCMQALLDDDNAALGLWIADLSDGFWVHEGYCRAAAAVAAQTEKPLAFATCYAQTRNEKMTRKLLEAGIPVLNGIRPAMAAVSAVLHYRDFQSRPKTIPGRVPDELTGRWKSRLTADAIIDEALALDLLTDFGIGTARRQIADNGADALKAADSIGYPVVLKTAVPGIDHKSDRGGVVLGLQTAEALQVAYDVMAADLGGRVLVMESVPPGVEIAMGFFRDPQFGPVVMIGAGGTLVEVLKDVVFALPPFDVSEARKLIDRLRLRPILDGVRGKPAVDIEGLAAAASRFSILASALGQSLSSLDVNPLIVNENGAVAVDGLIAANKGEG